MRKLLTLAAAGVVLVSGGIVYAQAAPANGVTREQAQTRATEAFGQLDLKRGQQLHITELPGGGFQALPYDPDFERTMEIADELMDKYRDTLAALAK